MITYQVETLDECLEDIKPLLEAHNVEVNGSDAPPIDPNYEQYRQLEAAGAYTLITARFGDTLCGYLGFAWVPSLQRQTAVNAIVDVIYLKPHWRRGNAARNMLQVGCDVAKGGGAESFLLYMPISNPFRPLLARSGFELFEENWRLRFS